MRTDGLRVLCSLVLVLALPVGLVPVAVAQVEDGIAPDPPPPEPVDNPWEPPPPPSPPDEAPVPPDPRPPVDREPPPVPGTGTSGGYPEGAAEPALAEERPEEILNDARLLAEARAYLARHADPEVRRLEVAAAGGRLTLSGTVGSESCRRQVEGELERLPGVREIVSRIAIRPSLAS